MKLGFNSIFHMNRNFQFVMALIFLLLPSQSFAQLNVRKVIDIETEKEDDGPRYNGESIYFDDRNLSQSEWYYKDQVIMLIPDTMVGKQNVHYVYGFYDMNEVNVPNIKDIDVCSLKAYKGEYTSDIYINSAGRITDANWHLSKVYAEPVYTPISALYGVEFIIRKASYKKNESKLWNGLTYRLLLEDKDGNFVLFEGRPSNHGTSSYNATVKEYKNGEIQYVDKHYDGYDGLTKTFYMMAPIHETEKMIGKTYNLRPKESIITKKYIMRRMVGGEYYVIDGSLTCTELCYMDGFGIMVPCLVYTDSKGVEYFEELAPEGGTWMIPTEKIRNKSNDGKHCQYEEVRYKSDLVEVK